ncbi:MAG: hypothetical protein WCP19_12855, partial [Chloroflexota bacterium]
PEIKSTQRRKFDDKSTPMLEWSDGRKWSLAKLKKESAHQSKEYRELENEVNIAKKRKSRLGTIFWRSDFNDAHREKYQIAKVKWLALDAKLKNFGNN